MKPKMAENSKGGILNKAEKILRRRKTQVMQSLGKTGKTTDDIQIEDCQKLEKQQEVATRFQKDLRNYIQSARALSVASKTFYTTLSETYEAEWEGQESVVEILKNMDMLWQDYIQKLQDQVQERLSKYLACIPQIKSRVAKSRRKLIDYDNAKHNLEVQESAKKKDDAKIAKAKDDLEHAKKIYEDLNNDLHQELPEFYKSRVPFFGEVFKQLFEAEIRFHEESGKVWECAPTCDFPVEGAEKITEIATKLCTDNAQYTYTPKANLRNTIVMKREQRRDYDNSKVPFFFRLSMNTDYRDNDVDLTNGHNQSSPDMETPSTSPATSPATSPTTNEPVLNGEADISKDSFDDSANHDVETRAESAVDVKQMVEDSEQTSENAVQAVVADVKEAVAETKTTEQAEEKVDEVKEEVKEIVNEVKDDIKPQMNGDVDESKDLEAPDAPPPPLPSSEPPEDEKGPETEAKGNDEAKPAEKKVEQQEQKKPDNEEEEDHDDDNLYQVPPPAKPIDNFLPKNYLYSVQATHSYKGEDDDELSFDCHETIYVIEYDDPEEQDPGWLMGMRKLDQKCGVFPENFTKRV